MRGNNSNGNNQRSYQNPDDRPVKLNPNGKYNMNFIDWQNEYQAIYNGMSDDPNSCPIYGMSVETFNSLMAEELEQGEYGINWVDEMGNPTDKNQEIEKCLDNIPKMKMGNSKQTCGICQQEYKKGQLIRKLPCKHIFHDDCIIPWFQTRINCPNCRFDIQEHFKKLQK